MDPTTAAFVTPASAGLLTRAATSSACPPLGARRASWARRTSPVRMTAAEPGPDEAPTPEEEEGVKTSATEILRTLREESDSEPVRNDGRSMLGVYRDVDGRSNVWAVEPLEETDTRPQLSKTTLIIGAAAFIIIALLVLPLLPFTNPDQV